MRRQFAAVAVLSTAAAVLSLAGCGGSSSTNPSSSDSFKNLPAAEQQTFETAAVDEITADISSFTSLSPLSGLFFEKVAPNRLNGALRMARVKAKAPRFQNTDCAAESGDLTDPDNDGVVNADTTTFNCNETSSGETITESGFFAFGDPTPNTTDLDISDAANLVLGITGGTDGNINLTLDGTAPTTFGTLPEPGQFSLSGSWTYAINTTSENINLSFTVSTPTPLTIDGCAGNPQGVDSGEVDIKFADGTLVKAVWTSCPSTPSITVT
jgi:hypothetical protein